MEKLLLYWSVFLILIDGIIQNTECSLALRGKTLVLLIILYHGNLSVPYSLKLHYSDS